MIGQVIDFFKIFFKSIVRFPVEVYRAFIAPYRIYKFLKSMLREGFYEIRTDFQYEEKDYHFRTLIQPDADIINYIPDIRLHSKKDWLKIFNEEYNHHLANIEAFMTRASESQLALSRIIDTGIIVTNMYPIWDFIDKLDLETAGFSGIVLALSAAFRKFMKPYVVKLSLKGIFGIAKTYFKQKL
ncbi:MAG: hypothetical protein AAGI07_17355 [Bacteroidota bacterium]